MSDPKLLFWDCEVWLPTKERPDYEVSSFGRVRSKTRRIERTQHGKPCTALYKGQYLKPDLSSRYQAVALGYGCKRLVHRLVATAFVPNPYNLPQVNHIDGNRSNNHASNLEWCTPRHNIRHALETGLKLIRYGEDSPHHKYSDEFLKKLLKTDFSKRGAIRQTAIKNGINPGYLGELIRGEKRKGLWR